jgi:hypothetical protein
VPIDNIVMLIVEMNRSNLIKDIETAFNDVVLENGVGIFEAEAIDDYADDNEVRRQRAKDREAWDRWQDIPDEIISKYYSVLCFVDPQGMKFLLPAYMCFALKRYDIDPSASIDSTIYALDRGLESFKGDPEILSENQKLVIAKFLKYLVLEAGDNFVDSSAASRAYEQHWSKYENEA